MQYIIILIGSLLCTIGGGGNLVMDKSCNLELNRFLECILYDIIILVISIVFLYFHYIIRFIYFVFNLIFDKIFKIYPTNIQSQMFGAVRNPFLLLYICLNRINPPPTT